MGVLIGVFVLTQTTVPTQAKPGQDQHEESDKQTSNDQLTISEAVTSSGMQLNLGFQSILLQEVHTDEEAEDQSSLIERLIPSSQKALKILFRRIISTNAP